MKAKMIAAAAALFTAVSYGADLGKYMLPDADAVLVSVGDDSKKGAYTKEIESAFAGIDPAKSLKEAMAGMDAEDAKKVEKVLAYVDLLTNGITRSEAALSLKATPAEGSPIPQVDLSAAVFGLKNLDKLFANIAADFPEVVKLEGGALVPAKDCGVKAKVWAEDGILRIVSGKCTGAAAAAPKAFDRLLKRLDGAPYSGLRVKDPVGIAKRFVPAEMFAEMGKDENFAEVLKLRGIGFDCEEDSAEPLLNVSLNLAFDAPETASSASEKLIAFKQMGLMVLAEADKSALDKDTLALAKKLLSGVKIAANGPMVRVKAAVDARDQAAQIKKALEAAK